MSCSLIRRHLNVFSGDVGLFYALVGPAGVRPESEAEAQLGISHSVL